MNSIVLHVVYSISALGLRGKALLVEGTAGMASVRQDLYLSQFQLGWRCFLQSTWYDAMFWFKEKNNIYGTPVFTVAAKQRCTGPRPFSVKGWEGTELGQLTYTGQRDILCHMTSCRRSFERGGSASHSLPLLRG